MSEFNGSVIRTDMFGRLDIYASYDDINESNVKSELNSALVFHVQNMLQEALSHMNLFGQLAQVKLVIQLKQTEL